MTDSLTDNMTMVVDYLKQWRFDPNNQPHDLFPKPKFVGPAERNYNLKNVRTKKFLQWERQALGINLGWTDNAAPATAKKVARWFLARSGTSQTPVKYGELIALGYGKDPSFVRYEDRAVGINLGWSSSPAFEWKLLGDNGGRSVSSQDWLAIYNEKAGECLLYFDRSIGGDVGWPSSQTWTDQLPGELMQAVRDHWKEAVALLASA